MDGLRDKGRKKWAERQIGWEDVQSVDLEALKGGMGVF
jgi:hypothetical protein